MHTEIYNAGHYSASHQPWGLLAGETCMPLLSYFFIVSKITKAVFLIFTLIANTKSVHYVPGTAVVAIYHYYS